MLSQSQPRALDQALGPSHQRGCIFPPGASRVPRGRQPPRPSSSSQVRMSVVASGSEGRDCSPLIDQPARTVVFGLGVPRQPESEPRLLPQAFKWQVSETMRGDGCSSSGLQWSRHLRRWEAEVPTSCCGAVLWELFETVSVLIVAVARDQLVALQGEEVETQRG